MTTTIISKSQIVDFNEKASNKSISSLIGTPEVLIRSRERVKKLAEVYTAKKEVDAMLNLIPKETWDKIDSTFLEPYCGCSMFNVVEVDGSYYEVKENRSVDGITHEVILLGKIGGPYKK